jgi:Uma2 family endonuclease
MMEAMAQPLPVDLKAPSPPGDHDHIVVLEGATWADYRRVLQIRGDRAAPRLAFLEGLLELMNPSRSHESIKSTLGCLVEIWCIENGVDISPYGSWTLEESKDERAVEPDECYVLGEVEEPERPDLAIEVIWTSGGVNKLEIYRKLKVREVWIWQKGKIQPWKLTGGQYTAIDRSEVLAGIDLELLARFIFVKPTTRAMREYRAALATAR